MAHPLAFKWTSVLINDINGQPFEDIEGPVMDLRDINEQTGSATNCTQGGNRFTDGKATPVNGQRPLRFRVLFKHPDGTNHRGFAIENSNGEVVMIVGTLSLPRNFDRKHKAEELADQTEATWVATKGG